MKFKYLTFFLIILLLNSCKSEKEEVKTAAPFEMYETSELALLMEEFYVYNQDLKNQIMNDDVLAKLPSNFDEIHSAKMTKRFERDENFMLFAKMYQENQKSIYNSSKDSLKTNYNLAIQSCIACHKTACTGPIPRIKKLLIN